MKNAIFALSLSISLALCALAAAPEIATANPAIQAKAPAKQTPKCNTGLSSTLVVYSTRESVFESPSVHSFSLCRPNAAVSQMEIDSLKSMLAKVYGLPERSVDVVSLTDFSRGFANRKEIFSAATWD